MRSRDDVYWKFGVTAEAAQLLETELGNLLLEYEGTAQNFLTGDDPERAAELVAKINKLTLGRLKRLLANSEAAIPDLEQQLEHALTQRNRLAHAFFRHHNFRINSAEGCAVMYRDLEDIHEVILSAYKALVLASQGIDLDGVDPSSAPTDHVPI